MNRNSSDDGLRSDRIFTILTRAYKAAWKTYKGYTAHNKVKKICHSYPINYSFFTPV